MTKQNIQLEIYVPKRFIASKLVYIELKGFEIIGIKQHSIKQSKQNVKTLISIYQIYIYTIQHYVIKLVGDLRQDNDFPRVLRFPPPIKLTAII